MTEPTPPPRSLPAPPPTGGLTPTAPPTPAAPAYRPAPPPPNATRQPYPAQLPYGNQPPYGNQSYGQPPPPPGYGYAQPVHQVFVQQFAPAPVIVLPTKNVGVSLLLTFFFGPLGMLYATVSGAIVMFFIEIVVAVVTFGLGLIITWPICMIWGAVAVNNYNTRLLTGQRP